jgi:radical SAM superfamily enzyme YgiQ (UPF0313 family)
MERIDSLSKRQRLSATLLLVVPPQRGLLEGFSTGLVAIANYIKRLAPSIQIRFVDLGLTEDYQLEAAVSEALSRAKGRVFVGITGTTASYQSMLKTAAIFKAMLPSALIVLGGHHVASQDAIVLRRHPEIDFVIRGEGEAALLALIRNDGQWCKVPNLTWRDGGTIVRNPEGPLLQEAELDLLRPTFEGGGLRSAAGKFDHVTYVSARGCPLKCAFCVVRASAIRAKSPASVVSDIRYLISKLGYRAFAIEDNFFAHQPKRTLALCAALRELRTELDFTWDCQTRVESMRRPDIAQAMAGAGCTAVYLGVEALVPKHLHYLGKTPRPDRYLEELELTVLPNMLRSGLDPYINLQLALPGEVPEDREITDNILRRLGSLAGQFERKVTVFPQLAVLYPGTPHFNDALQGGVFDSFGEEVFEDFTAWEAAEEPILSYLGEHFAHGVGGIPLGLLDRAALSAGRFAFSPQMISTVSTQLRKMEGLTGITVFRYGRYLAAPKERVRAHA